MMSTNPPFGSEEHFQSVENDSKEIIIEARKGLAIHPDYAGQISVMAASRLESLAICAWVLRRDSVQFQTHLKESALLFIKLCDRYNHGEKDLRGRIASSHSYTKLLQILAGGDIASAREFAEKWGYDPEYDAETSHPFAIAYGQGLRNTILQNEETARGFLNSAAGMIGKKYCLRTKGYVDILLACLDDDLNRANEALRDIVSGHPKELKRGGMFWDGEPDFDNFHFCYWGVGLANLARGIYGLKVDAIPPLLPAELLVSI